jgi:hypothetical protein
MSLHVAIARAYSPGGNPGAPAARRAMQHPSKQKPSARPQSGLNSPNADVCGLVDGETYSQRHRDTTQKMKKAAYVAYNVNKGGREFEPRFAGTRGAAVQRSEA